MKLPMILLVCATAEAVMGKKLVDGKDSRTRAFDIDNRIDMNQRESSSNRVGFSKIDVQSEGSFMSNKGNWFAIQRQLLQLKRQQAHLMNMLQDFMGGSHDSTVTLENIVRGLERELLNTRHKIYSKGYNHSTSLLHHSKGYNHSTSLSGSFHANSYPNDNSLNSLK